MFKELSEAFHNMGSKKDEMLEADPKFERRMTVRQGIEKMLPLYHNFKQCEAEGKIKVQTTPHRFFLEEIKW